IYTEHAVTTAFVPDWDYYAKHPNQDVVNYQVLDQGYQPASPQDPTQDVLVHAEVSPVHETIALEPPVVERNPDGGAFMEWRVDDPAGVSSLHHPVVIKRDDGQTVEGPTNFDGDTFDTLTLDPNVSYTATVTGFNDLPGTTPPVSQTFTYDPK